MMILEPSGKLSNSSKDFYIPFFRLAFRPFFWLGSFFSIIALIVWVLAFTGEISFNPLGGIYFWHLHEMLFGFTAAIIVGFLLTAVQTWTGMPSIKGIPLMLLVLIWLLARLLLAFNFSGISLIVAALDVAFLVLSAVAMAVPVLKAKLWRNLFFVPILLTMALINALCYASVFGYLSVSFIELSHLMILLVTLIMCIMGGRVFPMFTANGTGTTRVPSIPWLEKAAIISVALSILTTIPSINIPAWLAALVYCLAGIVNFVRAIRWRLWVTCKIPLVWSLHLSYWSVCIGFLMLGLVKAGILSNISQALHAITVGGIGFMALSMMSRVSLGHTGRMIKIGVVVSLAFVLIVLSFFIRVFMPFFFNQYAHIIYTSAGLWVMAYGIFVIKYAKILFSQRIDGAKG